MRTHIHGEGVLMNQFPVIRESGPWCICCNLNCVGLVVEGIHRMLLGVRLD